MNVDTYLKSVINKYQIKTQSASSNAFEEVLLKIKSWAGETLESTSIVGSHSKGTSISISNDIDILITLDSKTCFDLKNLYNNLFDFFASLGFSPFQKDISIGLLHNKISFDLIPAIKSSTNSNNVKIFNKTADKCIETNIFEHITLIKNSNLAPHIILTKIWREVNKLHFPSFYLELSVMEALYRQKKNSLEKNFLMILDFLAEDFISSKITDPANSKNIVSDILTNEEKTEIAKVASLTRRQASWEEIIW